MHILTGTEDKVRNCNRSRVNISKLSEVLPGKHESFLASKLAPPFTLLYFTLFTRQKTQLSLHKLRLFSSLIFFYFAKKLRPDPLKQIQNFAC